MKHIVQVFLFAGILFCSAGCSKSSGGSGGGGGNNTPAEQNLSIALSPDPGTTVVAALSDTYAFKLLVNSTPPTAGVKIDITGTKETDNSVQFSQTLQTANNTIKSVDLSLQNLAPGILYVVRVDVTSQTTSTNKASITFRVARK